MKKVLVIFTAAIVFAAGVTLARLAAAQQDPCATTGFVLASGVAWQLSDGNMDPQIPAGRYVAMIPLPAGTDLAAMNGRRTVIQYCEAGTGTISTVDDYDAHGLVVLHANQPAGDYAVFTSRSGAPLPATLTTGSGGSVVRRAYVHVD